MAARDETYRNQYWLDIVFAVSCILMLVTIIWMYAKDHMREYKEVQRQGRDIEVAIIERQAYDEAQKQHDALQAAERQVAFAKNSFTDSPVIAQWIKENEEDKEKLTRLEPIVSAMRAERDSLVSQYDKLVKDRGLNLSERERRALQAEIEAKDKEIKRYLEDSENRIGLTARERELEELKRDIAERERKLAKERADWDEAKKQRDAIKREHDRLVRLAEQKRIDVYAKIRALPVLDAFAPPYKIEQNIPDGLLINYNFKEVQRNDRCVTCHAYIGRAGFEKESLRKLAEAPGNYPQATTLKLSAASIAAYANHPRLDLYVGSNSPHPIEKFACTVCHAGQGGAATFKFAYHFPDSGKTDGDKLEDYAHKRHRWERDYGWHESLHPDYLWDFPMIPARFQESTCLKCHHQVVDLIRTDGKEEAAKLLKGYRLVRDNGCFGCHEIGGFKSGRAVGPDLRLEPYPPLDDLSPLERSKLTADPNDPPGQLRKVGPGLRRFAEKTNLEWAKRWIRSPRDFRPDTRMPHFFGLTNNHPTQLSDQQPGKESEVPDEHKGLPAAEIDSMAFYLAKASEGYLSAVRRLHSLPAAEWAREQQARQAFMRIDEIRRDNPRLTPSLNDPELPPDAPVEKLAGVAAAKREKLTKDQLASVLASFAERERMRKAALSMEERTYPPEELGDHKANAENGGKLFQTKGCVACHTHEGVKVYNAEGDQISAAEFGPNLIGLKDKLGNDKVKAEKWLYYWLTNPTDYHPRTLMPNPQLPPKDRADIIAWLLTDKGNVPPPEEFKKLDVSLEGDAVEKLARVYLDKAMPTKQDAEKAATEGIEDVSWFRPDADERILARTPAAGSLYEKWSHEDRLKFYAGRKSINRYGCFACHDIPGFETAKPIGTPLNDWGRKEPDRLAFEQIHNYIADNYHGHGNHKHKETNNADANGEATKNGHEYPHFFMHAIEGHRRDGFLYQKLKEPRSFDYQKLRGWEDRLKMPQFKFAHSKKRQNESDEDFAKRAAQEEEEAVEAAMTFILGLVAEPVPTKFVNQPRADRMNEVKGIALLEKYNCIGCHITKPGSYEFPLDAPYTEGQTMHQQLQGNLDGNKETLDRDPVFPEHSAWVSRQTYPPGKAVARGVPFILREAPADQEIATRPVELYEAIRFPDMKTKEARQYPAGLLQLQVPMNSAWQQHPPTGGRFAEVLVRILSQTLNKDVVGDRKELLGSVPPPLIREGQKVQTQWLLEFLRHPHEIRPSVGRNMRMPKFSLSHDETQALVNYFIAVDRLQNPALGLDYSAPLPPQRDPAEQDRMQQEFHSLVNRVSPGRKEHQADYYETGWRMLADNNLCLKCHDVGKLKAEGKPEEKGPPLNMVADRLRPEYIERWVANPPRFLPYTFMPQYDPFYAQADYHGMVNALLRAPAKAAVQVTPRLAAPGPFGMLWPLNDQLYNQILSEFALTPAEKNRLIRDVLTTWGYLADPPPTAVKAGPRGDLHGNGNAHHHGGH